MAGRPPIEQIAQRHAGARYCGRPRSALLNPLAPNDADVVATAAIGMVTQDTHLLHASIRENLRYGDPDATEAQLHTAARAAALHERILESSLPSY